MSQQSGGWVPPQQRPGYGAPQPWHDVRPPDGRVPKPSNGWATTAAVMACLVWPIGLILLIPAGRLRSEVGSGTKRMIFATLVAVMIGVPQTWSVLHR